MIFHPELGASSAAEWRLEERLDMILRTCAETHQFRGSVNYQLSPLI